MEHMSQEQVDTLLRGDTNMNHQFKIWQLVIMRDSNAGQWRVDFFLKYTEDATYPYFGMLHGEAKQCLPAAGNEHFIGTTDSPPQPQPEFKFGDKVEVSDNNAVFYEAIFIREHVHYGHPYEAIARGRIISTCFKFCRHADW